MTTKMKTASQQYLDRVAAHIQEGLLAAESPATSDRFAHHFLGSGDDVRDYLAAAIQFRAGRLSANSLVGTIGRMLDPSAK